MPSDWSDVALHIGVNGVDPENHPSPFNATLPALAYAENSAKLFASLAGARAPVVLLGAEATIDAVMNAILAAAKDSEGKRVFITFSGHGLELTDEKGIASGAAVNCWCLYDEALRDDVILGLLEKFDASATVVIVSDCCYGGGIVDGREIKAMGDRIRATVVAMTGAGPNAPAFAATGEPTSAFVDALSTELTAATPPKVYSELEKRIQAALWKTMMRQVPSVKRFGQPGNLDDVTPFWAATTP